MNRKEPLFRVVKRESSSPVRQALAYVAAVVIALLIGAALLSSMDVDPLTFYQKMVTMGIPGNKFPWRIVENFVKLFVPLLITSLALSLAFRMRFWNIGGEGQFIMGAICASAAAHKLGPVLPQPLVVLVMALCGILGGGLYGLIVALLKVRYNTNETLLTLMLNYIALYLLQFLGETKAGWNFFLDPDSARPKFAGFPDNADMITFPLGPFNLNLSLIIAIVLCVLLFGYLKYTKHGYEIAVIGESENTARYAGMNVGWVIMRTMFLSGAIAGVVGFLLVSGANNTLYSGVAAGAGFTAITVAWLAQLNPFAMVGISALLAVLQKGADTLNTQMGIPASLSDVITGVLLFFMLGCEFFINYKLVFRGAEERHKRKEAAK